jgi:two-component system phosphate regulon sensor histidine kinase PhoR
MLPLDFKKKYSFLINKIIIRYNTGKFQKDDLLEFYYVQRIKNKTIVYSNSIISEDYKISSAFFEKNLIKNLKI